MWKETKARSMWTFQFDNDPELLHIIKLGCKDVYAYFYEDAYEQEPWNTGLVITTKEEIESKFKITL